MHQNILVRTKVLTKTCNVFGETCLLLVNKLHAVEGTDFKIVKRGGPRGATIFMTPSIFAACLIQSATNPRLISEFIVAVLESITTYNQLTQILQHVQINSNTKIIQEELEKTQIAMIDQQKELRTERLEVHRLREELRKAREENQSLQDCLNGHKKEPSDAVEYFLALFQNSDDPQKCHVAAGSAINIQRAAIRYKHNGFEERYRVSMHERVVPRTRLYDIIPDNVACQKSQQTIRLCPGKTPEDVLGFMQRVADERTFTIDTSAQHVKTERFVLLQHQTNPLRCRFVAGLHASVRAAAAKNGAEYVVVGGIFTPNKIDTRARLLETIPDGIVSRVCGQNLLLCAGKTPGDVLAHLRTVATERTVEANAT